MVHLYGRSWSREELTRHLGSLDQLADVTLSQASDGAERGVRSARFRTGGGLWFEVLLDRAADVARVDVGGRSVAFWSNVGLVGPWYREPTGYGFLRSFAGGLLTTCGLDHAFDPEDEVPPSSPSSTGSNHHYPQHGRISNSPAIVRGYGSVWSGDECELYLDAEVRQAAMYGETLVLRRRISAPVGGSSIHVTDVVTNEGPRPTTHMFVYHCNFGFPTISHGTRVDVPAECVHVVGPRLPDVIPGPTVDAKSVVEQRHRSDGARTTAISIASPATNTSMSVQYTSDTLPYLLFWQMFGFGEYVLGVEPSTNRTAGRSDARSRDELRILAPGESVGYGIQFDFS
jgi:hypothetical protein